MAKLSSNYSFSRGSEQFSVRTSFFGFTLISLLFVLALSLAASAGLFVSPATPASAVTTVPTKMNFQGRLADSTGNIKPNGTYNMRLKLYTVSTAGAAVWSEDRLVSGGTGVTVTNGLFSIQLGSVTSLPASLFASGSLYLEVEFPTPATATSAAPAWTEGAMSPRNQMATSAYAYNAELLDGQDGAYYQDATNLIAGTIASARLTGSYTGLTGTGALTAGSIASGLGTILTGNTITGTVLNGTTGINTGAGAGTQRIDASGNLVNVGSITTAGAATLGTTLTVNGNYTLKGTGGGANSVLQQSGVFGSSTNCSTTQNRWIKLGQFTINGAWTGDTGLEMEIYPYSDYQGTRQRLSFNMRNGPAGINTPLITITDLAGPGGVAARAIADAKVVHISGSGVTNNVLALWVQIGGNGYTCGDAAVTARYYGTWSAGPYLTAQPSQASITDAGTQYGTNGYDNADDLKVGTSLKVGGVTVCTSAGCTSSGGSSLQASYAASVGGATPEVKLDSTRGGLDIQDADTTLGGNLLSVRASNASALGTALFNVTSTGKIGINTASPTAQLEVSALSDTTEILRVKSTYLRSAQNTFLKAWGTSASESAQKVTSTADGGYVTAGGTTANNIGIAKYDSSGNAVWSKNLPAFSVNTIYALTGTADGGFIMVASYTGGTYPLVYVYKFDVNGAGVWQNVYNGGPYSTYGLSVTQLTDGTCLVGGFTSDATYYKMYFVKYNCSSGATVAQNVVYLSSDNMYGESVSATADGGFIMGGRYGSYSQGEILKFDSSLVLTKSITIGTNVKNIIQMDDGNYIALVSTSGNNYPILVKLNSGLTSVAWSKSFPTSNGFAANTLIKVKENNSVLVSASDASNSNMFLRFNGTGSITASTKLVLGTVYDISTASDGGFVAAGQQNVYGAGGNDAFIAKYNYDLQIPGCSGSVCVSITAPAMGAGSTSIGAYGPSVGGLSPYTNSTGAVTTSNFTATTTTIVGLTSVAQAPVYSSALQVASNGNVCIAVLDCANTLGVQGTIAASAGITANATPDLAEYIPAASDVQAADVVMADPNNAERVVKASGSYNGAVVGVISDGTSSFMINPYGGLEGKNKRDDIKPLVLAGRVPVKITGEGGAVKPGDYLTTSSTPGYAMKATHAGASIGKALDFFAGATVSEQGTVLALINVSYYGGNSETTDLQGSSMTVTGNSMLTGDVGIGGSLNVGGVATLATLTVTGNARIEGNLVVIGNIETGDITVNGHIISSGNVPTITNSDEQCLITSIDGNDSAGSVHITVKPNCQPSGMLLDLMFTKSYTKAPRIVLSPSNEAAAKTQYYKGTTTKELFELSTASALSPGVEYIYDYMIIE